MRRLFGVLVTLAGLSLVAPDVSAAGRYDVHGCRLPDGTQIAADGWRPLTTSSGSGASTGCGGNGGLSAWLDPYTDVPASQTAGWVFDAPANTTIESYTLHRSATMTQAENEEYGRVLWFFHDAPIYDGTPSVYAQDACAAKAGCTGRGVPSQPLSSANAFGLSGQRVLRLIYIARCEGVTPCRAATSNFTIWASRIGLSDPHVPRFVREPSRRACGSGGGNRRRAVRQLRCGGSRRRDLIRRDRRGWTDAA